MNNERRSDSVVLYKYDVCLYILIAAACQSTGSAAINNRWYASPEDVATDYVPLSRNRIEE